jgi:hypothetical protein
MLFLVEFLYLKTLFVSMIDLEILTKLCELRERRTQNDSSQEELPSEGKFV